MKIYKYMAIAAVATFTLSAAQAHKLKESTEGFQASGGFAYSDNSGSEHRGDASEQWNNTEASGGLEMSGYDNTLDES